jgi:IS4 transposase
VELDQTIYALDSTIIDLCLSLSPWAEFRKRKGAIKLHTLLDLRGSIPTMVFVTHGRVHEVNILDEIPIETGAVYIMDRGYLDFARLYRVHHSAAFFVTRAKSNFRFQRLYSQAIDKSTGLQCDQTISLAGFYAKKDYPERLRRIRFCDAQQGKRLVFLTNNFNLPALTITELYQRRWQIELFFKWIKQHLRIKAFYGTSENAVKTQIWIAISIYVLVAIIRKQLKLERSLYSILQILSITLFEKMPLLQALTHMDIKEQNTDSENQLNLFS